jgi:hypothetical protein
VVLIESGTVPPPVALEIGAASAWNKPVYILMEGKGEHSLPIYASEQKVFEFSEISKVIELVSETLNPMTDEQRDVLKEAYHALGVPTDRLLQEPNLVDRLRDVLKERAQIDISGERIMQELLRLRKGGKLPRLSRGGKRGQKRL